MLFKAPLSHLLEEMGETEETVTILCCCNALDLGSVPGLGRSPGEWKDYSPQYSSLENGGKESDMTEQLSKQ